MCTERINLLTRRERLYQLHSLPRSAEKKCGKRCGQVSDAYNGQPTINTKAHFGQL